MEEVCRLRIAGLSPAISDKELKKRFKSFGKLRGIHREEESEAIIEIASSGAKLRGCVARYHQTKWKGHQLSVSVEVQGTSEGTEPACGGSRLPTEQRAAAKGRLAGDSQFESSARQPLGRKTKMTRQRLTTPTVKRRKHTTDSPQLRTDGPSSNGQREGETSRDGSISDEEEPGRSSDGEGQRTGGEEGEDELSQQLQEEKSKALSILDLVLATPSTHTQDSPPDSGQRATMNSDRHPSARSDLKDLFGQPCAPHTFDFQHSDSDSEREGDDTMVSSPKAPTHHQTRHREPATEHVHKKPPKLFYFHSGSDRLKNRLHENWFYRSHPLEELEDDWTQRRPAMRQAYKARHRDAVRMARKAKNHPPRPS